MEELTTEDLEIYRALLTLRVTPLEQLAKTLDRDPEELRGRVVELHDLGLVLGGLDDLRPGPPPVRLLASVADERARILEESERLRHDHERIQQLTEEFLAAQDRESVAVYTSIEVIRERLAVLAAQARTECLSITPGRADAESMEASRPLNEDALSRGVALKCLYESSVRNDRAALGYAQWLGSAGGEVRTVPVPPVQLVLVDRTVALVPLDPEDPSRGALEVRTPGLVAALGALFDQVWRTAAPIEPLDAPGADAGPSDQERELIRLLASGHTDESAARRMDLSVRTVRRIMAEVTQRLGARSRFEAGALAQRQGWLD